MGAKARSGPGGASAAARTTIRDVAREAGVAIASVSDILSATPRSRYKSETVRRVREAAAQLGYQPHPMASSLRRGSSSFVGLTLGGGLPPIASALVAAIRPELARRGYQSILADPAHLGASGSPPGLLQPRLLAGLISIDYSLENPDIRLPPAVARCCPVVAVYPVAGSDVDCVTTDRARAIEMAVDHLAALGHRRIATAFRAGWHHPSDDPKRLGWIRGCRKHGLDPGSRYALSVADSVARRIPDVAAAVADALVRLDPPPTAFVGTGDDYALALMGLLTGRGWRIPENLSVVGFDGIFYGSYGWPPLTTVAQPIGRIAEGAAARLDELIAQRRAGAIPAPEQRLIAPELVVRGSTAPVAAWRPAGPPAVPRRKLRDGLAGWMPPEKGVA